MSLIQHHTYYLNQVGAFAERLHFLRHILIPVRQIRDDSQEMHLINLLHFMLNLIRLNSTKQYDNCP